MNYKNVLDELLNCLRPYFSNLGYKIKKVKEVGGYHIYNETNFGTQLIEVSAIDYKIEHTLCASFMVCHEIVSEILKFSRGKNEVYNSKFTFTVVHDNNDNNLFNYYLKTESSIDVWVKDVLIPYFEEHIIPFFRLFETLENVDKVLNSNPSEESEYINNYPKRAQIGLIVAKLVNNANFNELSEAYLSVLEKEDVSETYIHVMNYLKNNTIDEIKENINWRAKIVK